MAITDNSFTGDELKAAVTANPALLEHVKGFVTQDQKFIMRTADEEKAFLEKYEGEKIGERVSQIAQNIERDVEAITGIKKKDANEKYYDYTKRALSEVKASAGELQRKIDELNSKTDLSAADRKRLTDLEAALAEKDTAINNLKAEKDKEVSDVKVSGHIDAAIARLSARYRKDLPKSIVELAERNARAEMLKAYKLAADGSLGWTDEKGEVITDPKNAFKPKAAEDILAEGYLKDLIDEGKKQTGTGAQGGSGGKQEPGNDQYTWAGIPDGVSTRVQLGDFLKKKGILDGSKEWNEIHAKDEVMKMKLR